MISHNEPSHLFMGKEDWQKEEWKKREQYRKKCKYYASPNDRYLAPIPANRGNCWFAYYCPRMTRYDKIYLKLKKGTEK